MISPEEFFKSLTCKPACSKATLTLSTPEEDRPPYAQEVGDKKDLYFFLDTATAVRALMQRLGMGKHVKILATIECECGEKVERCL